MENCGKTQVEKCEGPLALGILHTAYRYLMRVPKAAASTKPGTDDRTQNMFGPLARFGHELVHPEADVVATVLGRGV